MSDRPFKIGAHHVAILCVIVVCGLLVANLLRPVTVGDFGPGHAERTFGLESEDDSLLDNRSEMEGALALARAALVGEKTRPEQFEALTSFDGRRVFVTAYGIEFPAPVATGKGDNLYESIVAAATSLRDVDRTEWEDEDPASFRVRVDVTYKTVRKHFKKEVYKPPRESIGTFGILLEDSEGRVPFITGAEIVEQSLYRNKKKGLLVEDLVEILEDRIGSGGGVIAPDATFSRFYARSFIEGPGGEGIVELYRNHTMPNDEATAENLALSSRAAADYIVRIIGEDGKHNYSYDAHTDKDSRSYNMLRHGGTTYALAQAYDRFRDPAYKAACERSFEYLLSRTQLQEEEGPWGSNYRFLVEDRKAKLGGSGLALVAMSQYTEATGDQRYLQNMREFARFIVKMQDPESGKLISYYNYGPAAEVPEKDSIYYPGEALYGLGKFYFIDPNPLWLQTAVKGANWLIFDRDAGKKPTSLPHDHWLMMALGYLYAHTEDEAYKTHCFHIAEAIQVKHRGQDDELFHDHVDYLGTYYKTARVTPVGCRVEGLVGAADLANLAGEDATWLQEMAVTSAGFSMTIQFDTVNSFYLPNPDKALGGLRAGIYENDIRNDYVQHNLSSWLGVERLLLAERDIKVPGGPAWHAMIAKQGNPFVGTPPPGAEPMEYPGRPLYHIAYAGEQGQKLVLATAPAPPPEPEPADDDCAAPAAD